MKINGGSFNMMKALNESAEDELKIKKQVFMEGNKVTIKEDDRIMNDQNVLDVLNSYSSRNNHLKYKVEGNSAIYEDGTVITFYLNDESEIEFTITKDGKTTKPRLASAMLEACFGDRVKAIKKSLKKKDKRLSDKSAETSAKKIAGSMKESSLNEDSTNSKLDKNKIAEFLKKAIDTLTTSDYTCTWYDLDEDLAIFVGWTDGYDPDDEGYIHSENEPSFVLAAKIASTHEYMKTDLDWLTQPYYEDGEVWDTEITLTKENNFEQDAEWFIESYEKIRQGLDNGELLLESKSSLNEAPTEDSEEFKKLCTEIWYQADENDFTLTEDDVKGIAKKLISENFFFNHDIFADESDEEAWEEMNGLIIEAIESYPNKVEESNLDLIETSMEEIRQDSADKGLLEPEAVNEDDNKSNIIVYQIEDIRNCEYAFMSYDYAKEHNGPDMKDYKKVAEIDMSDLVGEDVEDKLESIFAFGNLKQKYYDNNPGARSISVSDIIEINGDKYYVDIVGFKKLDNKVEESATITEDDKGYIKQVLGIESGSDEETQLDNIFDTDYSLVWDELDDKEKKEYLKVAKSIRTLKPDEAFIDIEKEVKQKAKENHLEADILTYVYMRRYNKVEESATITETVNEEDDNYDYKELCHQLHQLLLPFENSQDESVNLDSWLYNTGKNTEFKDIVNKLKALGIKLKINYLFTPLNASKYYVDEYEKILSRREDNYEKEPVYIIKDGEYHSLWEAKEMKIESTLTEVVNEEVSKDIIFEEEMKKEFSKKYQVDTEDRRDGMFILLLRDKDYMNSRNNIDYDELKSFIENELGYPCIEVGEVLFNSKAKVYRYDKPDSNWKIAYNTTFPRYTKVFFTRKVKDDVDESAVITEATVSKDLHEVKSQGNIYMLQDNDKYIVGENYDSKEKLIENAEIYNNKEEADKDYLNRCGIKID